MLADGFPEVARRQIVTQIQVVVVEQVIELEAQLEIESSGQACGLVCRQIHLRKIRLAELLRLLVALGPRRNTSDGTRRAGISAGTMRKMSPAAAVHQQRAHARSRLRRPPRGSRAVCRYMPTAIGTDATLTLRTRRGTGYYKVPSLRGVWYRGPSSTTARSRPSRTGSIHDDSMTITCRRVSESSARSRGRSQDT